MARRPSRRPRTDACAWRGAAGDDPRPAPPSSPRAGGRRHPNRAAPWRRTRRGRARSRLARISYAWNAAGRPNEDAVRRSSVAAAPPRARSAASPSPAPESICTMLNGSDRYSRCAGLADNVVRRRRHAIERADDRDVVDQRFEREDTRHDPCIAATARCQPGGVPGGLRRARRDDDRSPTATTRSSSIWTASSTADRRSFPARPRRSPGSAPPARAWRSSRTTRAGRPTRSRRSLRVRDRRDAARRSRHRRWSPPTSSPRAASPRRSSWVRRGSSARCAAPGSRSPTPQRIGTQAVVVGWDRHADYEKLCRASLLVERGASLFATNADASYPAADGNWPGAGALLAAVETTTGARAEVFGKPEPPIMLAALERAGGGRPARDRRPAGDGHRRRGGRGVGLAPGPDRHHAAARISPGRASPRRSSGTTSPRCSRRRPRGRLAGRGYAGHATGRDTKEIPDDDARRGS